MPLWAGFSNNEIPVELGKLLTGQDYGGDAKECMDAVASHGRRQGRRTPDCVRSSRTCAEAAAAASASFFDLGHMTARPRHRHRLLDLGDQGDRLGPRRRGAWPKAGRRSRMSNPEPGHFEQDPTDWWALDRARRCSDLTARSTLRASRRLAISNQRETFGFFDRDGTALRPGMLWLDERARAAGASASARRSATSACIAISGKPLDIIPCLYRMHLAPRAQPELWSQAPTRIAEVHGFLAFHLTGRLGDLDRLGRSDRRARHARHGLVRRDPRRGRRSTRTMPRLVRPGGQIGEVTPRPRRRTGLLPGTPVIAGGGDGQCAGTGADVLAPGRAYVNLGTAIVSGNLWPRTMPHDRAFRTEIGDRRARAISTRPACAPAPSWSTG